jgi:hypothetical protein
MKHTCDGDWFIWPDSEVDEVKRTDPEMYKGVTSIRDKICAICGDVLQKRIEY